MKSRLFMGVFTLVLALFAQKSFATLAPIIQVTTDDEPEKLQYIGADVDDQLNLNKLYYQDSHGVVAEFSIPDLAEGQVILNKSNHDVVEMAATFDAVSKTGTITFTYLVNGIINNHRSVSANIKFDATSNTYQFIDSDDSHVITTASIVTNHILGKLVGIKAIDFN